MEPDLDAFAADLQARVLKDAREVYSEEVVRRWLDPPHAGVIGNPDAHARVTGPCGDTIEVFLAIREGHIASACFVTDGCAPTIASGSMACDLALGKTIAGLREVTQEGILRALGGLPEANLHCALLAAMTLHEAARDWAAHDEQHGEET
jgi:nitrogen fixation NifU-like protein